MSNITQMAQKAKENKVSFRPHFKTHQSLEIGRWFKENGVTQITVSSVSMAQYFATEWDDILIAFPVNIREINKINDLAEKIKLHLLVENEEAVRFLTAKLNNKVSFYIKIDTGYHRTGVDASDFALIDAILDTAAKSNKLQLTGFLTHAGHTYHAKSKNEILRIHQQESIAMQNINAHYQETYPEHIISIGDTPSCSLVSSFQGVNEIRPGNFVFYDFMQMHLGSCSANQIALAMACPVVAIHPKRNEMVIYGGGVHFSKDTIQVNGINVFGQVVETQKTGWGAPIPEMVVKRLSQEHGIIHLPEQLIEKYSVGDLVYVLPVHSCMTADIYSKYITTEEKEIARYRHD